MAFTSSLSNAFQNIKLRIISTDSQDEIGVYPLYRAQELPVGLSGPEGNPVLESGTYRMELRASAPLNEFAVEVCVNGSDPVMAEPLVWRPIDSGDNEGCDHAYCAELVLKEGRDSRPLFFLTYGFARVQITLFSSEAEICLSTKDIVSIGSESYQDELIEQMLNDLLNSSRTTVIDWMLTGEAGRAKRYSSIEAALGNGLNVSLLAYLQQLEEVTSFFRVRRNFFRYHGYTRVVKAERRLSFRDVRQLSRPELSWLSKNMEVLSRTEAKTSIVYRGDNYLPQYLESRKVEKSFDRYENRALLGFLDEVISSARKVRMDFSALLDDAQRSLVSVNNALKSKGHNPQESSGGIQLIRTFYDREKRLFERLNGLIGELEKERRQYAGFFAGVMPHTEKPLRRTKIFQEIEAYSVLYCLMERWYSGGDYVLGREAFALQIYRLDELYEYYVLYCILCWLHDNGFKEDSASENPISYIDYSVASSNAARCNIANLYVLEKEDTRVRLFYEPCISGGVEEEHGISLHRLSTPNAFSRKKKKPRPCRWNPDFLLEVQKASGELKYYIFDAKFRKPSDVYSGFPGSCEFLDCLFKYKLDIAGNLPEDRVSSVWLLCGRYNDFYFKQMEQSQWALYLGQTGSGIGTVTPLYNCLDELLPVLLKESIKSNNSETTEHDKSMLVVSDNNVPDVHEFNPSEAQVIAYVSDFYRVFYDKEKLFSAEWSQKTLGINHPLLRRTDPRGRESRKYREVEIDGKNIYVYVDMMPHNRERLIRLARKSRSMRS